jgi:hypothetical protein
MHECLRQQPISARTRRSAAQFTNFLKYQHSSARGLTLEMKSEATPQPREGRDTHARSAVAYTAKAGSRSIQCKSASRSRMRSGKTCSMTSDFK